MKQVYSLHAQGRSIRSIAGELQISRNTVRKYVRAPGVPRQKPRPKRQSLLEQFKPYIQKRLSDGLDNCVVLLRELKHQGYVGSYTILKDYVKPFRLRNLSPATMRFETEPGEQAQVDWGSVKYTTPDGRSHRLWVFVMVLGWSRAIYVEFVNHADVATFIRCHLNAFEALGGIPERCLYDNAKTVVLKRDEDGTPQWNTRLLDFALRLGFEPTVCRPYRAQTKGKVENGVKYVKNNFWPSARFVDRDDLNHQAQEWISCVANVRIHGTTGERPVDRLESERKRLRPFPGWGKVAVFVREQRTVGRDGYVKWGRAYYGVPWQYAGKVVEIQCSGSMVEIWHGDTRIAVHPKALRQAQFLTAPGQWNGLKQSSSRARRELVAIQLPSLEVECRSLDVYSRLAEAVNNV